MIYSKRNSMFITTSTIVGRCYALMNEMIVDVETRSRNSEENKESRQKNLV